MQKDQLPWPCSKDGGRKEGFRIRFLLGNLVGDAREEDHEQDGWIRRRATSDNYQHVDNGQARVGMKTGKSGKTFLRRLRFCKHRSAME